jgi:hypothetical protein
MRVIALDGLRVARVWLAKPTKSQAEKPEGPLRNRSS